MIEILEHTIIDSIKLVPFLFITYIIMELIEHHAGEKTEKIIKKSGKFGPVIGALLGIVPQCGFSAIAANFYAARIITRGTLIAIFLSTSDEMLPILISEGAELGLILQILTIKVVIGMAIGIIIDIFNKNNNNKNKTEEIHKICEHEHCHCEEEGVVKSSIKHTAQIFVYIFIITLIINAIIHFIGEDNIANFIINIPVIGTLIAGVIGTLIAGLIGVIPNCASSIILTELYLEGIITLGPMIAGLLVNSGVGILILFKVNKNKKENLTILGILYIVGITAGIVLDLLM